MMLHSEKREQDDGILDDDYATAKVWYQKSARGPTAKSMMGRKYQSKQAEKQVRHRATTMIIYQRQLFYIGSLPNLTLMIDMLMNHSISTCNPP